MCTTYYTTQSCMAENQPELQRTHRKTGQSKFDQVYSAINQSYAKIYTTINERFSPKKEDEKESDEGNSDTSSSFDDLMPMYDLKDLEIGPYYLQRETDALKSHLNSRELRQFTKKERKWERIMGQATGRPHEQTHEESIFYTEEDLCLKHYALSHPRTFPQLLHEGPPMQYRWSVWKLLLKPHRFYVDGLYEKLRTLPTTSEVQIKKDLHRTFPEEKYFASKKYNKVGQKQLENVLRAISLYFTNTGYVQGMNFLAGLLLLISGGDELESFWMLVALARDPKFMFMGLFEKDFPLLNFYVSMFYQVLEVEAPVLYHHMKKNQLPIDLWLFKWFLTIFVPTLPSKDVVRIWDLILRQGFLGIIKVAVGIVKFYDKEIMHQDAIGMNLMFQSIMEDHIQKECQENVNILNTLNPLINMIFGRNKDKNPSPNSKPTNVRCSFREFDVREVLEFAYEIDIDLENLRDLITVYENNSGEKLQEPYRKIMSNLSSPQSTVRRFKEFQNEIDYYIMRNALRDSERMGSGLNDATEA